MSNFIVDIDSSEVREFTKKLRETHRSHMPTVVRNTLNQLAFDVKKNELLKSADKEFILRSPSFFKRYSGVKKADGWDISTMQSEIGIIPGENIAAGLLEKQEHGGTVAHRAYIYMDTSRTGKNKKGKVQKQNYIGTRGILRGFPNKKRSEKAQFVANAIKALQTDNDILQEKDGRIKLMRVLSIQQNRVSKKIFVKMKYIASYQKERSVHVKARPFLRKASEITYRKTDKIFRTEIRKRFDKASL